MKSSRRLKNGTELPDINYNERLSICACACIYMLGVHMQKQLLLIKELTKKYKPPDFIHYASM